MKKLNIFAALLVGVICFSACEADRDSNPTIDLSHPQAPIHLNTPTFANSTYDYACMYCSQLRFPDNSDLCR